MSKRGESLEALLRSGAGELPCELGALGDCLRTVAALLAEKAGELEPSWSEALAVAAEIETLLGIERAVAERAIATPATDLAEVRAKLAIWQALTEAAADAHPGSPRDRLVRSVAADLDRLRPTDAGGCS